MPVSNQVNTPDNYVFGRPATHDVKKLADSLNEWSKDHMHIDLNGWIDEEDLDPAYISKWAKSDEYFGQMYRKAKARIAKRRSEMCICNEMNWQIYNKYQHFYDFIIHEFDEDLRDKDARRQARAKAEAEKDSSVSQEILDKFAEVSTQIRSLKPSDLNKADSNIKSEQ